MWEDLAVPFTMKRIAVEVDLSHLVVGDFDPWRVGPVINLRMNLQSFSGGCCCDQADDHFQAGQGLPSPVLADEGEQSMFDLVPLAFTRRKVADRHLEPAPAPYPLSFHLP